MTQSNFSLPNTPGATFRSNNNAALQALATWSSGASAPGTTYAGMVWWDTTANLIKRRNGANTAWITVASFDGSTVIPYRAGTALGLAAVEAVAAGGSAGLLRADGDGSSLTGISAGFRGTIDGLILSNNGTQAIDISAGQARNSGNAANLSLATALVNKQLNNNWAVGPAAGMLDTGSIAADTWYHIHAIRRPDTGVTDVLASLSATSPTMPTNYTQKRRILSVRTDGSSNILPFHQIGDEVRWVTRIQDFSTASPSTAGALIALSVPPDIEVMAHFVATFTVTSIGFAHFLFTAEDETNSACNATFYDIGTEVNNDTEAGELARKTNTAQQIRYRMRPSSSVSTFRVNTLGWTDPRGQNA